MPRGIGSGCGIRGCRTVTRKTPSQRLQPGGELSERDLKGAVPVLEFERPCALNEVRGAVGSERADLRFWQRPDRRGSGVEVRDPFTAMLHPDMQPRNKPRHPGEAQGKDQVR